MHHRRQPIILDTSLDITKPRKTRNWSSDVWYEEEILPQIEVRWEGNKTTARIYTSNKSEATSMIRHTKSEVRRTSEQERANLIWKGKYGTETTRFGEPQRERRQTKMEMWKIWDRKRGSPSLREPEPITYGNVKDIREQTRRDSPLEKEGNIQRWKCKKYRR